MTPSLFRGRPRQATSHLSVRVALAAWGGVAAVVWLVLPGMTSGTDAPVAITRPASAAPASEAPASEAPASDAPPSAAAAEDGTSTADLVLPLVAVGAAGAVAGYGYVRRVRRARGRTTPGGTGVPPPKRPSPPLDLLDELDEQARAALVDADDRVRTARGELAFTEARSGTETVARLARALRDAEGELSAAFRIRQRFDEGVPEREETRRHALAGVVGRCEEAGRRLDAVAGDFARLRGPVEGPGGVLGVVEARFRELTGRTGAAEALLVEIGARYAATATAFVAGNVEQAKDRLFFATVRLNLARQATDAGRPEDAARQLRAAEGAVVQADVLVDGVHRLAAELREAESTVPAALTGAEAELAAVRGPAGSGGGDLAALLHADAVLAAVRQEVTARQPYDPIGVLRRIVRATAPLAPGRSGVLPAAARLAAGSATAAADDFVATHRGAVGATARTRLAEARRLLASNTVGDRLLADTLALDARGLAEQDVRLRGNPLPEAAGEESGTAGAVLGGLLPGTGTDEVPYGPVGFGHL
ncbi:hypothetical protein [Streptomyces sp. NPDC088812]|uniref:hypothetical protein n=1 Tax=Streptomyces sp. NPDC088812 TaxID=3365905 RepID=UPI0037F809B1